MKRVLASCFGLGRLPVAPGTWGSLPPAIVFVLMLHFEAPGAAVAVAMALLTIVGSAVCVICSPAVIAATGRSDPREVVADEFAGQAVTFMITGMAPTSHIWTTAVVGFFLFRFFDIFKPWPIGKLEKLSGGWGILADDLMAGVYAGTAVLICSKLWLAG